MSVGSAVDSSSEDIIVIHPSSVEMPPSVKPSNNTDNNNDNSKNRVNKLIERLLLNNNPPPTYLLVILWFISSLISVKINYLLLKKLNSALGLSMFQLSFTVMLGGAILFNQTTPELALKKMNSKTVAKTLPLGVWLGTTSVCYNLSMHFIPVSFLNTVKSTVPLWTCLYCRLYRNTAYSVQSYLTLIPIVGGVAIASLNEVGFNLFGFILACGSAFATTMYNLKAKDVMESGNLDSEQTQLFTCVVALILLSPLWLVERVMKFGLLFSFEDGFWTLLLVAFICGTNWFVEMNLSVRIIKNLGALGYAITDVVRRLVVIIFSAFMFGNAISERNAAGVMITMFGVVAYNLTKEGEMKRRKQPQIKKQVVIRPLVKKSHQSQ